VVVKHTYKEVNQCADASTSCGVTLDDNFCFYELCSTYLSQLFVADVIEISMP
jgi:hypothetical protein